jgi:class 3 adenylate cyclase
MNTDLFKLKDTIEQTNIVGNEKKGILQLLGKTEKEIKKLNSRLERALKDKKTLSRLLSRTSEDLEKSSELIKRMFGRYLSTEVMNSLLDDPSALELGGERRKVTIMMTDLRGFTALSERLKPEQVVQMLNSYFEIMVDVVLQYNGNINEIIGDALLVIFGAPQEMSNRAQQAIACAIEMQRWELASTKLK